MNTQRERHGYQIYRRAYKRGQNVSSREIPRIEAILSAYRQSDEVLDAMTAEPMWVLAGHVDTLGGRALGLVPEFGNPAVMM